MSELLQIIQDEIKINGGYNFYRDLVILEVEKTKGYERKKLLNRLAYYRKKSIK